MPYKLYIEKEKCLGTEYCDICEDSLPGFVSTFGGRRDNIQAWVVNNVEIVAAASSVQDKCPKKAIVFTYYPGDEA